MAAKKPNPTSPQPPRLTPSERARRSMERRLSAGHVTMKMIVPREVHERLKTIAARAGETQAQALARLVGATGG